MDIILNINVPQQRRDIEESANGLSEVIAAFIEEIIQAVVIIHDGIPRETLIKPTTLSLSESGPWMSLTDKHPPQSDNRITEIVCNNLLLAIIYLRRDDLNFVETTFFLYLPALEKLRKDWLEKNKLNSGYMCHVSVFFYKKTPEGRDVHTYYPIMNAIIHGNITIIIHTPTIIPGKNGTMRFSPSVVIGVIKSSKSAATQAAMT